jgi:hypothetical protein
MKASRYTETQNTETQILGILREAEGRMPVASLCRAHGMSACRFTNCMRNIVEWVPR